MGPGAAWAEAFGYGRLFESSSVFFTAKALEHQEAIGGNAQRGVMVEATPVAPLVVAQAHREHVQGQILRFAIVKNCEARR